MRDPSRIDRVIETIRRTWHLVPDWRLGQLACNLGRECGSWDSFYVEDDKLEAAAMSWLASAENKGVSTLFVVNKKTFPTFQEAVDAAIELCGSENFEIRRNSDKSYDLIWTSPDKEEQ